jgi:deazaflavin-dependent oxidoreductase (nitroreductase family)
MNPIMKLFVKTNIVMFRLTNGRLGSSMSGNKILLLTTIGNKSGQPRTVPVMQFDEGGKRYVIGSFAGAPEDPAWIRNIRKTPEVEVETRGEQKYRARASLLSGEERTRIYEIAKQRMSNFIEYEKKTTREIPVVLLTPIN